MVLFLSAAIVLTVAYQATRKAFKVTRCVAIVATTSILLLATIMLTSQVEGVAYSTAAQGSVNGLAALVILAYAGKRQLRTTFR